MLRRHALRGLSAALLIACGSAGASGLQVAPVGLEFAPASSAQGLWLTNTGGDALHAQARVFHWTQVEGKDVLPPTQSIVASPPMLSLASGTQQLVRVIRTGAGAGTSEDAYRVVVDELPPATQARDTGVRYVLRYSVPVFVEPANAPDDAAVAAALQWSLVRDGNGLALQVRNTGTRHAQLSDATLQLPGGKALTLTPGLLGYALPSSTMRWPVKVPAAQLDNGTLLKVMVNGKPVEQKLAGSSGLPR